MSQKKMIQFLPTMIILCCELLVTVFAGAQSASSPAQEIPPAASIPGSPSTDDRYKFVDGFSTEVQIELTRTPEGARFVWPNISSSDWDTAILAVRSWGAEANPMMKISAGSSEIVQYLDPNAIGLRWLNLSGLRNQLSNDVPVEIGAHAVTIEAGIATLRLFKNKLDLTKKILILAPHPDDAELAAFGLYADRNSTIVTVTSGNAGDMNYRANVSDPAEHYLLKGYLRAVDSVTVPWQGQIPPDRTFNLGYFDARLFDMYQAPDSVIPELYGPNENVEPYRRANISKMLSNGSRTNTWNHLVEDLVDILRKVKPDVIVIPDPRLDSHLDHEYTAVALVKALDQWKENPLFLLYTNHAAANRYPYGPAGTVMSLPPWSSSEIMLQKVYSHPTDAKLQLRKLFALESMHDLRLSPEEQDTCDVPGLLLRPDYPRVTEVDYLRRGPRSNELFYVYDRDGVQEVVRSFLANSAVLKQ
jgi:LmbE family N-acetylglucosaminyl deacetylase